MKKTFITLLVLCLSINLFAQRKPYRLKESRFSLGFGGIVQRKPYKGFDTHGYPIPFVNYESNTFFFRQLTAGYHLFADERIVFDLIAQGRLDGYDDDDSSALEGMSDRDPSLDAGAQISVFDGWGRTKLSFVGDTLSKHRGHQVEISYSKRFSDGRWSIIPSTGIAYESQNLIDYYYGVRDKESRPGRPAYEADAEFSFIASLAANYRFNEKWSFYSFVGYRFFGSEVTDSPIVSRDYNITAGAGLSYNF